jgi:hypothetical protein
MEGRRIGRASLTGQSAETYEVREHSENFQPPQFVGLRPDLSRVNIFQNQQSGKRYFFQSFQMRHVLSNRAFFTYRANRAICYFGGSAFKG